MHSAPPGVFPRGGDHPPVLAILTRRTMRPHAEVAEWQTRRSQKPLRATSCGFDSHLRYHHTSLDTLRPIRSLRSRVTVPRLDLAGTGSILRRSKAVAWTFRIACWQDMSLATCETDLPGSHSWLQVDWLVSRQWATTSSWAERLLHFLSGPRRGPSGEIKTLDHSPRRNFTRRPSECYCRLGPGHMLIAFAASLSPRANISSTVHLSFRAISLFISTWLDASLSFLVENRLLLNSGL